MSNSQISAQRWQPATTTAEPISFSIINSYLRDLISKGEYSGAGRGLLIEYGALHLAVFS